MYFLYLPHTIDCFSVYRSGMTRCTQDLLNSLFIPTMTFWMTMSTALYAVLRIQLCSGLHHPYAGLPLTGICSLVHRNFEYLFPKGSHFLWVWNAIRSDLSWNTAVGIVVAIGSCLRLAWSFKLSLISWWKLLIGLGSSPPKTTIIDHSWLVILMVTHDVRAHAAPGQHLLGLLHHIGTMSKTFCGV